ncbi:hypothetical protein GWK47_001283 [Chionoecetes opilio]|uniref:Integrase zinc-binding domain-containing protein n=1 Tax=Chionoecetes opilio TaxID=41210 RepID=A0A8J5CM56_CHIOP|nr:hypothetical protein GWK47_001283 [Chionoecetes opilio]
MMDIDVDPLEIKGTLWSSVATGENEKIQDDLAKNSKITQKKPRSNISVDEYERACRDRFAVENLKFERLIHYLKANKHPEGLTNNEKKQIYRLSSTHQWDATGKTTVVCPSGGHVGQTATQEKISKLYTWKNMTDDIRHYIETCEECHPLETQDPLKQSIKLEEVWKLNEVDVIGEHKFVYAI